MIRRFMMRLEYLLGEQMVWGLSAGVLLVTALLIHAAHAQTFGTVTAGSPYPVGSTPVAASASGTTAATTATLPASLVTRTYICGFAIDSSATAVAVGNASITGVTGGTMNFNQPTQAAASGVGVLNRSFIPCLPTAGVNTAVVVTSAAAGAGGVVTVNVWGYQY